MLFSGQTGPLVSVLKFVGCGELRENAGDEYQSKSSRSWKTLHDTASSFGVLAHFFDESSLVPQESLTGSATFTLYGRAPKRRGKDDDVKSPLQRGHDRMR